MARCRIGMQQLSFERCILSGKEEGELKEYDGSFGFLKDVKECEGGKVEILYIYSDKLGKLFDAGVHMDWWFF